MVHVLRRSKDARHKRLRKEDQERKAEMEELQ
jgi:hypothetical protein